MSHCVCDMQWLRTCFCLFLRDLPSQIWCIFSFSFLSLPFFWASLFFCFFSALLSCHWNCGTDFTLKSQQTYSSASVILMSDFLGRFNIRFFFFFLIRSFPGTYLGKINAQQKLSTDSYHHLPTKHLRALGGFVSKHSSFTPHHSVHLIFSQKMLSDNMKSSW